MRRLEMNVMGAAASVLGLALLFSGCGPGAAAEAIRPKEATAAGAMGEGECHEIDKGGEPLVVDWKPEQRGDLEVAMKEGVAVVAYSCKGIKLLGDCHIDGKYGFMGMTKKEQVVRLQNADEVRANLPLSGVKLGGELERGSTLDIAMVMVGKKRTTWEAPTKEDLKGKCDGATHFVRGATVGAFVLETGTQAKVRAAAEIFGASAGAGSSSDKHSKNQEGDPADCSNSTPDSEKPPGQCGAPIRLVLLSIGAAKADKPDEKKPTEPPKAEGPKLAAPEEAEACPKDLVFADGKCTSAATAAAYQCKPHDVAECTAQCGKGHPGSCGALGAIYASGSTETPRDWAKANPPLKKACDGGELGSCVSLGHLVADGLGTAKDPAAAAKLYEKGCSGGIATGCYLLGEAYQAGAGVGSDPAKASNLFRQSCEGGESHGCGKAARLLVEKDVKLAAEYFKRGCDGNDGSSCNALGEMHEIGKDVRNDKIYAAMLYQRGCFRRSPEACTNHGRLIQDRDPDGAKRDFTQACFGFDDLGCAALKVAYGDSRPVFAKVDRTQALQRTCASGVARDCTALAVLQSASGQGGPMAKNNVENACIRGDAWACLMKAKIK